MNSQQPSERFRDGGAELAREHLDFAQAERERERNSVDLQFPLLQTSLEGQTGGSVCN